MFCQTLKDSRFETQSFADHRLLKHVDLDSSCSSLASDTSIWTLFFFTAESALCLLPILQSSTGIEHVAKRTLGSRHDAVAVFSGAAPNGYRRSALGVFGLCTCWRRLGVAAVGTMVAIVGK